jgi:alpha-L-rhamnosidase
VTDMHQPSSSNWEASWIWGSGDISPRNEWRCFRRSFIPDYPIDQASLRITADSRYVVYVNGEQVGRGPVRSWPFELACDEYEIGHLLHADKENVIAVLVIHYGISTFQYLRGRGGLLLQMEIPDTGRIAVSSDDSWTTAVHQGHDSRSSRISCQLGFTEVIDARAWDPNWNGPGFDDSNWDTATVIGPVGMQPWTRIVERGIPHLTEEPVYPVRLDSLSSVQPIAWSAVLDIRSIMVPESANHANPVQFCGYLATGIRLVRPAPVTIGFTDDGRLQCSLSLDGRWIGLEAYTGEHPERYVTVNLSEGEHLLLLDVTGTSHGHSFHIGIDCEAPFEIYSPIFEKDNATGSTPFIAIGPFDRLEDIDHLPSRALNKNHPEYLRIRSAASIEALSSFPQWIRAVDSQLINRHDVFTSSVWRRSETSHPVPSSMQHAILAGPNAASIPVYEGMDTEIVIDYGRERSGYISFELDAGGGTVVEGYGLEYMRDGWRQHTHLVDNTFHYTCREGRQSYVSVIRRGLRYLTFTIRGATRPVKFYEVKLLQSNYPVADVGAFQCSDPLLDRIWTISRDTTRLCMEDTFVDCPAFEQAYWVGDARNEALVNYYTFGAREIVERCLKLVPGSSFQTPLYADQVPSGWNSVIPNWTFFWVTACLEYYRYDGNRKFVTDIWPHVKHTLGHYLTLLNEQGLLDREGWNLLDWAPFEQPREGIVTPQNMFLVQALRNAAVLGSISGDTNESERFLQEADKLCLSINANLWDGERAAYLDCIHRDGRPSSTISMQSQIVAYLCDIASSERRQLLEQYLVSPPSAFVQAGSPFMSFFYYEALAKLGRFDLLLADMRDNYGYMVENGATTCWEMYPFSVNNQNNKLLTRSHCHAWSAGPAYFLGAHVLGVQGLTPGWSQVRIAPQPCGLTWARGSVPLPDEGRIDVSWRISSHQEMHLRIEAPKNIEIHTEAPEGFKLTVQRV